MRALFFFRILVFGFFILILIGCNDTANMIPLNTVEIPEYNDSDYIRLLDDKDPEIVYSAVCHFINNGASYAQILSTDTIKNTIEVNKAKQIYSRISKLLFSNNEWIVCSSLRFFSNFGMAFKDKNEIANQLLKVDLRTKSIKIEFINAMHGLYGFDGKSFENKMIGYMDDKSWLISRYSFKILPFIKSNVITNKLIEEYNNAPEYDRLLIINALNNNYNDTIVDFFINELSRERSNLVRMLMIKNFTKANNKVKLIDWLITNYNSLDSIKVPITEYYMNNIEDTSASLFVYELLKNNLLNDGVILDENRMFYDRIYSNLYEKRSRKKMINPIFLKIDKLLLESEKFKSSWIQFVNYNNDAYYSNEFIDAQKTILKEYMIKSSKLFDKYKIDEEYKERFMHRVENLNNEFESQK